MKVVRSGQIPDIKLTSFLGVADSGCEREVCVENGSKVFGSSNQTEYH